MAVGRDFKVLLILAYSVTDLEPHNCALCSHHPLEGASLPLLHWFGNTLVLWTILRMIPNQNDGGTLFQPVDISSHTRTAAHVMMMKNDWRMRL